MSTFRVTETVPIRGRGLLLCGYADADPSTAIGATLTAPDGRTTYPIRGVERQGMKRWRPGDPSGVLVAEPGPAAGDVLTFGGVPAPSEPEGPRCFDAMRVFVDGRELVERPSEEEPPAHG